LETHPTRGNTSDGADLDIVEHRPGAAAVERTAFDQRNRPVERAVSTYRGDRYTYQIALVRPTA